MQAGSAESKKPGNEGIGSDEEQLVGAHAREDSPRWAKAGGWRTALFSNSLLLVMGSVFLASWLVQSLAGLVVFNDEQAVHGESTINWLDYVVSADFWNRTL